MCKIHVRIATAVLISSSLRLCAAGGEPGGDAVAAVNYAIRHASAPPLRGAAALGIAPGPTVWGPALRGSTATAGGVTEGVNFDGIGQGSFGFAVEAAQPDVGGAAGATQFVQWVNGAFAVFNKATGGIVYGPVASTALWQPLGGPCASNSGGGQVVEYDKVANRWLLAQPVLSGPQFAYCVAVSAGADATGAYDLYSFSMPNSPSNAKLAVWSNAYLASFDLLDASSSFIGSYVCALDRTAMLAGAAAPASVCFNPNPAYQSLLPADLDSLTPPPAGSPGYFMNLGSNALNLWRLHINFANPSKSKLSGPVKVPVAKFSRACGGGACIPQSGTRQLLDSLATSLMYRLVYRNFGDHESILANHSVKNGAAGSAIRWYELRSPGSAPVIYQQDTYAPDSAFRWAGGIAMDGHGGIVAGYNVSSSGMHPSSRFAFRAAGDALGTLEPETAVITGTGSQTGISSWGSYASLGVDPVDDCTFWFSSEHLRTTGNLNWNTRVASFALPGCTTTNPTIQITSTPQFGSFGFLEGQVSNVTPADYQVAPLLFIPGLGWWAKPTCNPPLVQINSDGSWAANVDTGGVDATAQKYVAYLVPQGYSPVCWGPIDGLPPDLEAAAAARAFVTRPNPAGPTVEFSGQTWDVTTNSVPLNPGLCTYSSANASVDAQGYLHLQVTNASGAWTCAQVVSEFITGYGTYTFQLRTPVDNLDPNIVLGLFTWSDDPAYLGSSPWVNNLSGILPSHSELDIEFSRWGNAGDPNNAQYTVQPYNNPACGNPFDFAMPAGLTNSTHKITWMPGSIVFESLEPGGSVINKWTYTCPVPAPSDAGSWPGPVPSPQGVRLNLWLYGGQPPSNGQPAEIVVGKFVYTPAAL